MKNWTSIGLLSLAATGCASAPEAGAPQEHESAYLSVGSVAPDFDARTLDGHEFKLSDYRGKVVLVDFYGFW